MPGGQSTTSLELLSHLATFSMIITDDGAFALGAISRVYFDEGHIVLLLISGVEVELSEIATKQFLDVTKGIAESLQAQAATKIIDPRTYSRH